MMATDWRTHVWIQLMVGVEELLAVAEADVAD